MRSVVTHSLFRQRVSILVFSHPFNPRHPGRKEGKSEVANFVKHIPVSHDSPHNEAVRRTSAFDRIYFVIRHSAGDSAINKFRCSRSNEADADSSGAIRQRESKIIRKWNRNDLCGGLKGHIVCRRIATVEQTDLHFKDMIGVLKDSRIKGSGEIGTILQGEDKFLSVNHLARNDEAFLNSLGAFSQTPSNPFHSRCGTRRFEYGCPNIARLSSSNFVHFLYGLFQPAGLNTKNDRLKSANKHNGSGQPDHPPIGRRLAEFLCFSLGGFIVSLCGWQNLDKDGRLFSAALVVTGHGLTVFGGVLWIAGFYRWSWDWWL